MFNELDEFNLFITKHLLFTEATKEADAFRQKLLSTEASQQKLKADLKTANNERDEVIEEVRNRLVLVTILAPICHSFDYNVLVTSNEVTKTLLRVIERASYKIATFFCLFIPSYMS